MYVVVINKKLSTILKLYFIYTCVPMCVCVFVCVGLWFHLYKTLIVCIVYNKVVVVVVARKMSYYFCDFCNIDVPSNNLISHSRTKRHKLLCGQNLDSDYAVYVVDTAFQSRIITYRFNGVKGRLQQDPKGYLLKVKGRVKNLLSVELQIHKQIKVNLQLFCYYVKFVDDEVLRDLKSFNTKNVNIILFDDGGGSFNFESFYLNMISSLTTKCEEFQERDSGWSLEKIEFLELNINKWTPLRGGSSYIPLAKWVQKKHAVINVNNKDNACFLWSVVAAMYPADRNSNRVSSYPMYKDVLKTEGINTPVKIQDIKRFEKLNKISINVYGISGNRLKTIQPMYISQQVVNKDNTTNHINLLYFENKIGKAHYAWIKNLSRLLSSQVSSSKCKRWFCDGCLRNFTSKWSHKRHTEIGCVKKLVKLPTDKNKHLKFTNFHHQLKVPFVIYADFESILSPIRGDRTQNTFNTHKHIPYSFAYYIYCDYNAGLSKFVTYRGSDCVEKFIDNLHKDAEWIINILETIIPPSKSCVEVVNNTICHICEKSLEGVDSSKIAIDHCHLTGKIRGRTHRTCNILYSLPKFIPVVFHNLSGYDSHLFIKQLAKSGTGSIHCIPHNKKKYISFNEKIGKYSLRFIDSFKFMSTSLQKLVNNLQPNQFKILPKFIHTPDMMKLLTRKGVFPYEYVGCWDKLEETSLPSKENFYSTLSDSHISDCDYEHAKVVWETFHIKTLGEYSDLYLKTDVLLLAEVFENFRNICLDTYKLDPCQYLTTPSLSCSAMMKYTKVELELLIDYEMIQFIKSGIRGGISQVSKRYCKANNKFMKDYNPNEESTFLVYLDVNNLYGDSMRRCLPINNFRWLNESEITLFDVVQIKADSDDGYFLEVDLEYPTHLHHIHNDYPFCGETKNHQVVKQKNCCSPSKTNKTMLYTI